MAERTVMITGGAVGGSYKTSFICAFCQKGFNHKGNFMKHYRTHTGEKPFQCPKCPYKATQKAHLTTHMVGRHGELPNGDKIVHGSLAGCFHRTEGTDLHH